MRRRITSKYSDYTQRTHIIHVLLCIVPQQIHTVDRKKWANGSNQEYFQNWHQGHDEQIENTHWNCFFQPQVLLWYNGSGN